MLILLLNALANSIPVAINTVLPYQVPVPVLWNLIRVDPDPYLHLDPHQSDKLDPETDPDPHQFADVKPECMEYEPILALFKALSIYLAARI